MLTTTNAGGLVRAVYPGSLGEYIGIRPGDRILSVNGRTLRDEIDFRFYSAEDNITLELLNTDLKRMILEIEKEPDDSIGIVFEDPIFDGIRTCVNNCSFCFISQLPSGMRKSLYLRDDDYRLSFLFGNFISLTNLEEEDWHRLNEQKLSPLRVSLHTSDPETRAILMGNPKASTGLEDLRRLKDIGISTHIQIVLLRGINDGDQLLSTLDDLESLGDSILSVGIVPAVYTKHRLMLPSPKVDPQWAQDTISMIENYGKKVYKKRGVHWVYAADELYFVAGVEFPEHDFYDDFPQFENGIGMVADFRLRVQELRGNEVVGRRDRERPKVLAVTGVMAYPEIVSAVRCLGLERQISVLEVENHFFGDTVTCAGLLTGIDISCAILDCKTRNHEYEGVLIPSFAVFEGKFLDDLTVDDLREIVALPVRIVDPSPDSLLESVSF